MLAGGPLKESKPKKESVVEVFKQLDSHINEKLKEKQEDLLNRVFPKVNDNRLLNHASSKEDSIAEETVINFGRILAAKEGMRMKGFKDIVKKEIKSNKSNKNFLDNLTRKAYSHYFENIEEKEE